MTLHDLVEGFSYKHLTNIVKAMDENSKPKFKEREKMPKRQVANTTKEEIEEFWRPIWENASENAHQDDWIWSIETALKQRLERPSEDSIQITEEVISQSAKKK